MNIKQEIRYFKILFHQGSDLLMLRLRLLRLDVQNQLADVLTIVGSIAAAAVLSLIGLAALLLGLNVLLPAEAKLWVFFGVAALALLAVLWLVWRLPRIWYRSNRKVSDTLGELQNDLARLRGGFSEAEAAALAKQADSGAADD